MLSVGVLISLAMVSPALATGQDDDRVSVDTMLSTPEERYGALFLEAVRQEAADNDSAAFSLVNQALGINPNAAAAYFLRSRCYSNQRKDSLAKMDIAKSFVLDPSNASYLEAVAQVDMDNGDYKKAISDFEGLYAMNYGRDDALRALLQLYGHEKDYRGMLSVMSRVEQNEGRSEETILGMMNIYDQMGDEKAAYKALKGLSDDNPTETRYRLWLGNWLAQHKREKEAYKIFMDVAKAEPNNAYAQTSLYDYYKQKGDKTRAYLMVSDALTNPGTPEDIKISMLNEYIKDSGKSESDSSAMFNLLKKAIGANPNNADIASANVNMMRYYELPQDSVNVAARHVLAVSPANIPERVNLIQGIWKDQNWADIIALSKEGVTNHPDYLVFYYFIGLADYQKDDTDSALNVFKEGLRNKREDTDSGFVSNIYAMMGDILQGKGMMKEAYAAYDTCLVWNPNNAGCLNNYAYYLSVEGKDLAKAGEMSYKTVLQESNNSTYLDTYAWILFMEKRYAEAKIYIDLALKSNTDTVQSGVILEHAGDIYYMNNEPDQAMKYWQEAREAGGASELLEQKIKQKKYVSK